MNTGSIWQITFVSRLSKCRLGRWSDPVTWFWTWSISQEKVDVVVADPIGNFGFNVGIIQYFADARRRFLKPEGVTIPLRMDLMLAHLGRAARVPLPAGREQLQAG